MQTRRHWLIPECVCGHARVAHYHGFNRADGVLLLNFCMTGCGCEAFVRPQR